MKWVWCTPNITVGPDGSGNVLFVMCLVCAVTDKLGKLWLADVLMEAGAENCLFMHCVSKFQMKSY